MLAGGVAALQQPRPAVDVHQTLVVVVVDGGAQDSEVELLGAGVVDILQADGRRQRLSRGRFSSTLIAKWV